MTGPDADGETVVRRPRRRRRWRLGLAFCVAGLAAVGTALLLDETFAASVSPAAQQRVSTPLVSARRAPELTTGPLARRRLAESLAPVVATAPPGTCVEVGDTTGAWYSHNGAAPLAPASNLKLLTAAAALDVLGPDTTLKTTFSTHGSLQDGVLTGNLYMIGGGDPLLTTEAYQAPTDRLPETDLEAVADRLVAAGLRRIDGSVVGDETRYDGERTIPTWPERHREGGTIAPLSALLVNDAWTIDPTTGAGEGGPAADPAAHAAAVLTQLLTERGVAVAGVPASGAAPVDSTEILSVESLPVKDLVAEVLRYSDNTTAELLVKEMGRTAAGEGSTAAGVAAMQSWAAENGIALEGSVILDGSGLSYENLVTCDQLAAVLRGDGPSGTIAAGLAVPGQPGTLQERFEGSELANRLRAKTGTLNTVTALSGWVSTIPGHEFDFEILQNTGERRVQAEDLALQQLILETLLNHPLAPPLAEAGPLPARPAA